MKNLLKVIIFIFFAIIFLSGVALQQVKAEEYTWGNYNEYVESFDSTVEILPNSDLVVTERITVVTLNNNIIKRGLTRDYPLVYNNGLFINIVDFKIISIKKDDKPVKYHTETLENGIRILIGEESFFLKPGKYIYEIKYQVDQMVGFFEDHDELFYNINGQGWIIPIKSLSARVILPKELPISTVSADGYTGVTDEKGKDFTAKVASFNGQTIIDYELTRSLFTKEGFTTFLSFPKDIITPPTLLDQVEIFIKSNWQLLVGIPLLIWSIGGSLILWLTKGRDPATKTIIPLFNPPDDISPARLRYLHTMKLDETCLSAALIRLAVKQKITINKTNSTFSIKNNPDKELSEISDEEKDYIDSIFSSSNSISFDNYNQSSSKRIIKAYKKFEKSMKAFNAKNKYIENNRLLWICTTIFPLVLFVAISFIYSIVSGITTGYLPLFYLIFLIVGLALIKTLVKMGSEIKNEPVTFFTVFKIIGFVFNTCFILLFIWVIIVLTLTTQYSILTALLSFVILLLLYGVASFMQQALKRRTPEGRKLADAILGFKMFLETADRHRIEVLIPELPLDLGTKASNIDPVVARLKLFEYYLPYAVALNIEKKWSSKFTDELKTVETGENNLDWYTSAGAFSAASFSSSFSSGLSSSIASSSSTGSSGSSGSSGGAGGGGGGGGGGGW